MKIADMKDVRRALEPISEIYQGHPMLQKEVRACKFRALDLDTLRQMCAVFNTNIEGLMEKLGFTGEDHGRKTTNSKAKTADLFGANPDAAAAADHAECGGGD